MHLEKNELTLLYNSNLQKSKQTLAIAHSISKKINMQDICSVNVSRNLFCIMLNKLGIDVKDIVNKSNKYYQENLKGKEFRTSEWFHIIKNHPELLINPIGMFHGKSVVCNTPTDILKIG